MRTHNTPTASLNRTASDNVMIAIRKIIQAIDLNSRQLHKRVGLTGPQLVILQEIDTCMEMTPGEIAKAVSLSQSTVTGILDRLEKRQLISRRRSDGDRRRIMVRVTEIGKNVLAEAPTLMQETFVVRFMALQEWEQSMILSALQRLVALMDAKAIDAAPFLSTSSLNPNSEKSNDKGPQALIETTKG